jgi:hypothetical protein
MVYLRNKYGKEPLNLTIKLSMFKAGDDVLLYSDNLKLEGSRKPVKLDKEQELQISIPSKGGSYN